MSENPSLGRVFRHRTILVPGLRDSRRMGRVDREVNDVAAHQVFLVTRDQVFGAGGSDDVIENRVAGGSWVKRHAGVYQTDSRPSSWEADLIAAVLAAGEKALVSHRAALLFWGMDGISSAPIEITVPFGNLPIPEGVVVHRTRRPGVSDGAHGSNHDTRTDAPRLRSTPPTAHRCEGTRERVEKASDDCRPDQRAFGDQRWPRSAGDQEAPEGRCRESVGHGDRQRVGNGAPLPHEESSSSRTRIAARVFLEKRREDASGLLLA